MIRGAAVVIIVLPYAIVMWPRWVARDLASAMNLWLANRRRSMLGRCGIIVQ
jgi:hypothetical protein